MPVPVPNLRTRFRWFLERQLTSIEKDESSPQSMVLEPLLRQAVEGLVALDYGEVQTIVAPAKKRTRGYGTKPYTLRRLRMKAIGFADLLIAKEGEGPINRKIAEAFGIKADRFRGWKKSPTLGKTNDRRMQSFRREISQKIDWDEKRVMAELAETAAEYKLQEKLAHK
jgi:hypothetical protein